MRFRLSIVIVGVAVDGVLARISEDNRMKVERAVDSSPGCVNSPLGDDIDETTGR